MQTLTSRFRFMLALLSFAICSQTALATKGGDHPLIGHYEGSEQVGAYVTDFDEVEVIDGPISSARGIGAPGWLRLEGKITLLYYKLPAGRSSLEVLRNYQASFEARGFRTAYTCSTNNGSCYIQREGRTKGTAPYDFALALDANPELPRLGGDFIRNYFGTNARYLLARLTRPEGTVYVSLSLSEHDRGNYAFIRVIETKAMDSGKIGFIDADDMQKSIADSGRVNLYGIHFDFDKDTVKSESKPTLDEIAKLLRTDATLMLTVVGHTDAKGDADYNLDLSRRRATNVSGALARDYGIASSRLQSRGAGADEPIASNDDEDGRAKNRRVELVKR
jgi:outer membrane protein OmpA-like peptidoglycan-associated protein